MFKLSALALATIATLAISAIPATAAPKCSGDVYGETLASRAYLEAGCPAGYVWKFQTLRMKPNTNIRAAASVKGRLIATDRDGTVWSSIGSVNGWYHVALGNTGRFGWIHGSNLAK